MRGCALVPLVVAGCLVDNPAWLGLGTTAGSGEADSGEDTGDVDPLPVGCEPLPAPPDTALVADSTTLDDVIANAAPGATIVISPGTYDRAGRPPLAITADGVTVRGSGEVVLDGGFASDVILEIRADDVTIADLALRNSNDNLIRMVPDGAPILRPRLYRLELGDSAMRQVSAEVGAAGFVDEGEVACSRFEITAEFRATLEPCKLGALRVNAGRDWHVHDNRITGHWCASAVAETAVQFSDGARDTLVERNVLIDNQRGIGFGSEGAEGAPERRAYADNPCTPGVYWGHIGGTIRNNAIWIGEASSSTFADAMIYVWTGCDVQVLHNTVVSLVDVFNSMEYRFPSTTVTIANNLFSDVIMVRDGAMGQELGNLVMADLGLVVDPLAPDLHLRETASEALDQALPLSMMPVLDDFEGDARDGAPDIGADERIAP